MAPSISGHGGEFELVEDGKGNFIPVIDFTLPSADTWVALGDEDRRRATLLPPKPEYGVFEATSGHKHPNNHPTHRVRVQLAEMGDYWEDQKSFKLYPSQPPDSLPKETMNFVVRYYPAPKGPQTIKLIAQERPLGTPPAVQFDFDIEAGFYVAVIVYNFREWHPSTPLPDQQLQPHRLLTLHTDMGVLDQAARDCYVYIVVAKDQDPAPPDEQTWRNPQQATHGQKTLKNASLTINMDELNFLMGEGYNTHQQEQQAVEPLPILYHAPAQQIEDTTIERDKSLTLQRMTEQDPDNSQGAKYIVNNVTPFLLGLYLFVDPPIPLSSDQVQIPVPEPLLVNLNTANEAELVNLNTANEAELISLPGIGTVLAGRIITYRAQRPFTAIKQLKEVSGIKDGIFAKIAAQITV